MAQVYITTAIPYVNSKPHLGFALELVLADALARSHRARGDDVRRCTGTDENSLKNVLAAQAAGEDIATFVARQAAAFAALREPLDLVVDDFVRTSVDPRHRVAVEALWRACLANGDLYRGHYEGMYCLGCEAFLGEREVTDGRCPEHGTPPQPVRETNWFFRLVRYGGALRSLVTQGRLHIQPEHRRNEVLAQLDAGLEDFCVSRPRARTAGWGIPVPDDPENTIYVWFDALVNYLSGLGYPDVRDGTPFARYWRDGRVVHVIGKGIARFHALYWPAMLLSAGVRVPDVLWIHGYATIDGAKISKSSGGSVSPASAAALHGTDALRHYLLLHIGSEHGGDYAGDALARAYRHELADTLGNLCSRTLAMVQRYRNGQPPAAAADAAHALPDADRALRAASALLPCDVHEALRRGSSRAAVSAVLEFTRRLNAHASEREPWKLAKRADARHELDACLFTLLVGLRAIARALLPYMPHAAAELQRRTHAEVIEAGAPLFPRSAPSPHASRFPHAGEAHGM